MRCDRASGRCEVFGLVASGNFVGMMATAVVVTPTAEVAVFGGNLMGWRVSSTISWCAITFSAPLNGAPFNGALYNGAPFNGALNSVNKTLFDTI